MTSSLPIKLRQDQLPQNPFKLNIKVDLMDLSKDAVEHDGLVYRYVLSVMDVLASILGCAHWKRKKVTMLAKPLKRSTQNMVHHIAFKATVDRSLKEKLDLFVRQ